MFEFAPPFVEAHGIIFKRDAGDHARRGIPRKIDIDLQAHETLEIIRIRMAELAQQRGQDFEGIHLQHFLPHNHLVDAHRIDIQPCPHPQGTSAFLRVQRKKIHRIVHLPAVERKDFLYDRILWHFLL